MDIWIQRIQEQDRSSNHNKQSRKEEGVTYTPSWIVEGMLDLLDIQEHERVHEMSCGRGMFVLGLVNWWHAKKGKSWEWIECWAQTHLYAVDTDPHAVSDLKSLWVELFHSVLGRNPAPLNVDVEDGLFGSLAQTPCDVIVGNPPYVRIQHLDEPTRIKLRTHFQSCQTGNVDLYYAFLENACSHAKRVCLITPNSWMSNRSAGVLRSIVIPRLEKIVDFKNQLVFAPVRAYTSVVLLSPSPGSLVFADSLTEPTWTPLLPAASPHGQQKLVLPWPSSSSSSPVSMSPSSLQLGDVCHILGGLATLSDKSFVLPSPKVKGKTVIQVDEDGRSYHIPLEYAPIFLKATEGAGAVGQRRIVFPYNSTGKIVSEALLQQQAPDVMSWLLRHRPQLDRRDKGKTQHYDAWYAYGRRQGLHDLSAHTQVVVVPQMGNGKLHPFIVDCSSPRQRFVWVSGFVVVPRPGITADQIVQALSSPQMWQHVERHGKLWAGKGDYRTIGAKDLRSAPWVGPIPSPASASSTKIM